MNIEKELLLDFMQWLDPWDEGNDMFTKFKDVVEDYLESRDNSKASDESPIVRGNKDEEKDSFSCYLSTVETFKGVKPCVVWCGLKVCKEKVSDSSVLG